MRDRITSRLAALTAVATVALLTTAPGAIAAPGATQASANIANSCVSFRTSAGERWITTAGPTAYASVSRAFGPEAEAFFVKPTLGKRFMLSDTGRFLLSSAGDQVVRSVTPGPAAEVTKRTVDRGTVLTLVAAGRDLVIPEDGGAVVLGPRGSGTPVTLFRGGGCTAYPEASTGAAGRAFRGTNRNGTVFGFADTHVHITSDYRAGGRVIDGEAFDRFGITEALGHDDVNHGIDGSMDTTGNILRGGSGDGTHDIRGWPTFTGWPVHDTITHQQTYYMWLKRSYLAGLRLVVAQTVEDEPLCTIEPLKSHSCDETATAKLEISRLRAMQRYIDAQAGGRGRGWFQIAEDPRQARKIIEKGKLAVVIGLESSDPLGCSESDGVPGCTRKQIDARLDALYSEGVRSLFIAHWVDNALAGPAFEGGDKGTFIALLNKVQTGQNFESEPCTTGDEDNGECNARGLTSLGAYLVRRMMAKHMLIEVDHLSEKAREGVLRIAEAHDYPLVSSHTGTGGEWTPSQLRRLYALGGMSSATPSQAAGLADRILTLQKDSGVKNAPVGLGSDTGGFSSLPGPRDDAAAKPLVYPFRSYDGKVRFTRERTGTRTFDLNTDGVAHYGLFADLIADMQAQPRGPAAERALFRSAEGYLRLWSKADPKPERR